MNSKAWREAEARLAAWFAARGLKVARFQRAAWRAFGEGKSGLIHAPTGTGKTLAALGGPMIEAMIDARAGIAPKGLRMLWITPLRALASDTASNLEQPLRDLDIPWRLVRRTGDSGSAERAKLKRGAAEIVVTTPESLSLMLSYPDSAERLRELDTIVVDEWHELIGSKRGVQLELCLTRLKRLAPRLRIWGLSATFGNVDEALDALLGPGHDGVLVEGKMDKRVEVETALPHTHERFPWAGHLGLSQLPRVLQAVGAARTSLVFTNTRSQAELWHEAIKSVWPHEPDTLALHHGSLDRALRRDVEIGLREGRVRCVVATSSLDLGVDFGAVERVIQIGSPRGVARLVQRAGRSGHRPGEASRVLCVPTHNLELVEIAAARRAIANGVTEPRRALRLSLDVLAQHLVTIALAGGFDGETMYAEVRSTFAFAELGREAWNDVLDFIVRGGRALDAYPAYRKVAQHGERYEAATERIGRLHRLNIGTIASDGSLDVRFVRGGSLGHVEETFIARLVPGERFLFAGRSLELVRVRDMTAYVRLAEGRRGSVPRWLGGRLPLSNEMATHLRHVLGDPHAREPEVRAVADMLEAQRRLSIVPSARETLVETVRTRNGEHLFVFAFAGRLAHEGLAAVLAYRLGRVSPTSFSFAVNDYGLVLSAAKLPPIDTATLRDILTVENLREDMLACLNLAELARRQFREIARVAGLVFTGYPGRDKSVRQLQASSGLIFDVLARHDPGHLLLRQAIDEVLDRQLDFARLSACLERIAHEDLVFTRPAQLTPLSFPLWCEGFRGGLSSEDWEQRVRRLAAELERRAA